MNLSGQLETLPSLYGISCSSNSFGYDKTPIAPPCRSLVIASALKPFDALQNTLYILPMITILKSLRRRALPSQPGEPRA